MPDDPELERLTKAFYAAIPRCLADDCEGRLWTVWSDGEEVSPASLCIRCGKTWPKKAPGI